MPEKSALRCSRAAPRRRVRTAAAVVLLSSVALTACSSSSNSPASFSSSNASGLLGGDDLGTGAVTLPVAAGPFDSTSAELDTLAKLQAGHLLLVYFGYTHCPDVCPTTMATLGEALTASTPAVQNKTRVAFITSDPERDTVPVLRQWLANFDAKLPQPFVGLTGTTKTIDAAADKMGIPLEPPVKQKDGTYTVDHGAQVLAFQNGTAHVLWLAGTSVANLTHDLALVASGGVG
jgi:protein SCO1/2